MIDLAERYEKGTPPKAGGVLDQTQSFLEAQAFIQSEIARCKNVRRKRDE